MGKSELVALLVCLTGVWLFLTMPRVCLQFVIVVFPDHTHLLFCADSDSKNIVQKMVSNQVVCHITCRNIDSQKVQRVGKRNGLGAKSQTLSSVAPPRKKKSLFSVRDMSGGLRNPCFTKFSVVIFLCKWPVITVTPKTLKISVHKIQD